MRSLIPTKICIVMTYKLSVNKEVDVIKSKIESSSGFEILDFAAAEFIYTLKFMTAKANDEPVHIWITMVFEYKVLNSN